jgi:hypothetical protein
MRAQAITQVNVITMRRERLPALDAQISLMPPSRSSQPRDRRSHGRFAGSHHVHVDDRLGIQPGTAVLPTCSVTCATSACTVTDASSDRGSKKGG